MRIMFFAAAMGVFSFFRTFFVTALAPSLCVRMKPFVTRIHTTVRIRPRPKNKPAFLAGSHSAPRDIRVYRRGFSRPIAYRFCRYRTYSTEVTSSPSNLPLHRIIRLCVAQALMYNNRPVNISQEKFRLFGKKFSERFVWFARAKREAMFLTSLFLIHIILFALLLCLRQPP